MVALGHLTAVDTVHCVGCKPRCVAAIGLASDFDFEIRSTCLELWALVLCKLDADTKPLVGKDTLADIAVGIADTETAAAIDVEVPIALTRGLAGQKCLGYERNQVDRKELAHYPLVVLGEGLHEAVGDTS